MKKRRLSLLLVLALLLVSCGDVTADPKRDETSGETTPAETTAPEGDGLPDVKFDGWELKILNYTEGSLSWCNTRILVEEQTGDVLDDAIYERNANLEDRFDFKFVVDEVDDVPSKVSQNVLAGDNSYYIYAMQEGTSGAFLPYTLD